MRLTSERVAALYDDGEWCATAAGLTYIDTDSAGVRAGSARERIQLSPARRSTGE